MAHEAIFQALHDEIAKLNGHLVGTKNFLEQVRNYAVDLKALAVAGKVHVQSVAGPLGVQPIAFDGPQPVAIQNLPTPLPVSIPGLANPLPVSLPAPATTPFLFSAASTGDLVAAQAGAVRLVMLVAGASAATLAAVRSNGTDLLPLRLATPSVVLPYYGPGYVTTASGEALRLAFTGGATVTAFGLWSAA